MQIPVSFADASVPYFQPGQILSSSAWKRLVVGIFSVFKGFYVSGICAEALQFPRKCLK